MQRFSRKNLNFSYTPTIMNGVGFMVYPPYPS